MLDYPLSGAHRSEINGFATQEVDETNTRLDGT